MILTATNRVELVRFQEESCNRGGDIVDWAQIIGSLGFPIVACLGMGWYVKYQTDTYREEVKDMQKEHKEEIHRMSEALDKNTEDITKLCEKLDKEKK